MSPECSRSRSGVVPITSVMVRISNPADRTRGIEAEMLVYSGAIFPSSESCVRCGSSCTPPRPEPRGRVGIASALGVAMATRTIATPNVTFEAFDEGRGPLVLCLHGFPDHAIVPPSDPRARRRRLPRRRAVHARLRADERAGETAASTPWHSARTSSRCSTRSAPRGGRLRARLGRGRDVLRRALAPTASAKIVTAAVPYGPQFFAAFTTSPAQIRRSWYMFFFQSPLADVARPARRLRAHRARLVATGRRAGRCRPRIARPPRRASAVPARWRPRSATTARRWAPCSPTPPPRGAPSAR